MLVQQKWTMPPPTDEQQEQQQKMMKYMMIFMGLMFYKVASGLCIYFIASSVWGFWNGRCCPRRSRGSAGRRRARRRASWRGCYAVEAPNDSAATSVRPRRHSSRSIRRAGGGKGKRGKRRPETKATAKRCERRWVDVAAPSRLVGRTFWSRRRRSRIRSGERRAFSPGAVSVAEPVGVNAAGLPIARVSSMRAPLSSSPLLSGLTALLLASAPPAADDAASAEYHIDARPRTSSRPTNRTAKRALYVTLHFKVRARARTAPWRTDVNKDELVVLEDGKQVEPTWRFSSPGPRLTTVLAMDISGSMEPASDKIDEARKAANIFLDKLDARIRLRPDPLRPPPAREGTARPRPVAVRRPPHAAASEDQRGQARRRHRVPRRHRRRSADAQGHDGPQGRHADDRRRGHEQHRRRCSR